MRDSTQYPVLPPGTLLQMMYLEERLGQLAVGPGRFLEVGAGDGHLARLLLDRGWTGELIELDEHSASSLSQRFATEIADCRLTVRCDDFLAGLGIQGADAILSCMVLEYLDEVQVCRFLGRASQLLRPGGRLIGLVPASPAHWGVEDEIAGHFRRYTRESICSALRKSGWRLDHVAGLTFPISNVLYGLSNFLVRRSESGKLSLDVLERTKLSGRRTVNFKTRFPRVFKLILNRWAMWPLHLIQQHYASSERAMVLYFEASQAGTDARGSAT